MAKEVVATQNGKKSEKKVAFDIDYNDGITGYEVRQLIKLLETKCEKCKTIKVP